MSIIYCGKHDRRWDSDELEECPLCENEPSLISHEPCVVDADFRTGHCGIKLSAAGEIRGTELTE